MSIKCASEKILKIGQYLTKIWTITKWNVFFWDTLYIKLIVVRMIVAPMDSSQLLFAHSVVGMFVRRRLKLTFHPTQGFCVSCVLYGRSWRNGQNAKIKAVFVLALRSSRTLRSLRALRQMQIVLNEHWKQCSLCRLSTLCVCRIWSETCRFLSGCLKALWACSDPTNKLPLHKTLPSPFLISNFLKFQISLGLVFSKVVNLCILLYSSCLAQKM